MTSHLACRPVEPRRFVHVLGEEAGRDDASNDQHEGHQSKHLHRHREVSELKGRTIRPRCKSGAERLLGHVSYLTITRTDMFDFGS